jgi:hypothetical protein
MTAAKHWPADAFIVVAPVPGEAVMRPEYPTTGRVCRDCGAPVVVRLHSLDHAEASPYRHGKPVGFLCVGCAVTYDRNSLEKIIDLRPNQSAT